MSPEGFRQNRALCAPEFSDAFFLVILSLSGSRRITQPPKDMAERIFVSYARVNNLPDPGSEKGWVSTLVDFLNVRLPSKVGTNQVEVWTDDRLAGNESLTESLRSAVSESSIFMMVSSEAYLASKWCSDFEMPEFINQNLPNRIFRVELEKIDRAKFPEQLRDALGYRFWSEDSATGFIRPLLGVPERRSDEQFFRMIDRLVQELALKIKAMEPNGTGSGSARSAPPTLLELHRAAATGPAVFLASAVPELAAEWCRVQSYLEQNGLHVITPEILPFERVAYMSALEAALAESILFIQLLGREPVMAEPDDAASEIALQVETAQRLKKPIIQWRDPALDVSTITDEKHRSALLASTVEQMGIEDFKAFVAKRALAKPRLPRHTSEIQEGSLLDGFVFLDRAQVDKNTAKPIVALLNDLKVDCVEPLDQGDPEDIRVDLEENLSGCDALIIVYGDAPPGWVRAQVRQSRRAKAKRGHPLILQAIYEGPPLPKEDLALNMPGLKVIPSTELNPDKLREFLQP